MIDRPLDKAALRAAALARRQAFDKHGREAAAHAIADRATSIPRKPAAIVAGYMPIRGEIDPHPLMRVLAAKGASLSLPTIGSANTLIFRSWREGDALHHGAFGISEPLPDAAIAMPDIVLVPLAAFDRRGHRIGYGAGHYDRALAKLRIEKPIIAIGLAFATQEIPRVPDEAHDVPLDLVLTENETIVIRSV